MPLEPGSQSFPGCPVKPGNDKREAGAVQRTCSLCDETKLRRYETNFYMDAIGWKPAGSNSWLQQGVA